MLLCGVFVDTRFLHQDLRICKAGQCGVVDQNGDFAQFVVGAGDDGGIAAVAETSPKCSFLCSFPIEIPGGDAEAIFDQSNRDGATQAAATFPFNDMSQ